MIVDPIVEATLNELLTYSSMVNNNPMFEGIVNTGFARDHKFIKNIMGFDIYTSNRLPTLTATEALNAASKGLADDIAEVGDVVNMAMCIGSDQTKPLMRAWRMNPNVETRRNFELKRDEYDVRARFGLGAQRVDTLATIITSATTY